MLTNVNQTTSRVSWWLRTALAVGGLALLATPVVYLSRVEPAVADDPSNGTKDVQAEFVLLSDVAAAEPTREFLPAPSESEERILAALEKPVTFQFVEMPLNDAVAFLKDSLGDTVELQIDTGALEDAGVGLDASLTRSAKNLRASSALKLILEDLDLSYIIHNDVLLITTTDREEAELFTRIYPVGDLVGGPDPDYDHLVDAITTTVLPQSWNEVGGASSIVAMPNSKSVVVSQTRRAHDEILQLLRSLRAAQQLGKSR